MSRAGTYGLTDSRLTEMEAMSAGTCAICHRRPERGLCIDHCHATGMVRGLICHSCNLALGLFQDDAMRMIRAVAYLGMRDARMVLDVQFAYARQELDRWDCLLTELLQVPLGDLPIWEASAVRAAITHARRMRDLANKPFRELGRRRAELLRAMDANRESA